MTADTAPFFNAITSAVLTIPSAVPRWGRGWCAAVASILEAAAAKPGNVHPLESFEDLAFDDFVAAGWSIAPSFDAATHQPLGPTILAAAKAAAAVTTSNANLGIILLLAPIAAVPDHEEGLTPSAIEGVLARLDASDAVAIWKAIRLARPGGLGHTDRHDLAGPPPLDIREAMRLAADHDMIARLWARGYQPLFEGPVADLAAGINAGVPLETTIIRTHLRQLARQSDSLIVRKHGAAVATEVSARAADLVARESDPDWQAAVAAFDTALRSPRRLNPGTTADFIAAALYILLLDGRLRPSLPREFREGAPVNDPPRDHR